MSVWFAIPSANYQMAIKTLPKWRDQGYRIAIMLDEGAPCPLLNADFVYSGTFRSWAIEVNHLARRIYLTNRNMTAVVTGGDDIYPCEDKTAHELEAEFLEHFPDTFGIMQPVGDGFCGNGQAAVSPWLGREWIRRGYGGQGPLYECYQHFCPDTELCAVARHLGIYWERPDVSQFHAHWTRLPQGERKPWAHLDHAQASRQIDSQLFQARKATGFPGSAPL